MMHDEATNGSNLFSVGDLSDSNANDARLFEQPDGTKMKQDILQSVDRNDAVTSEEQAIIDAATEHHEVENRMKNVVIDHNTYSLAPTKPMPDSAPPLPSTTNVQQVPSNSFYRSHPDPIIDANHGTLNGNINSLQPDTMYYHNNMNTKKSTPHVPPQPNFAPPPPPDKIASQYRSVRVLNPRFVTSYGLFDSKSTGGYWVYGLTTIYVDNSESYVDRRFSHFVALESRLREACPGSILPARPDKKNSIEETALQAQSQKFAITRAKELEEYLSLLISHPYASLSPPLQTFLGFVANLGLEWPEVSNSTLTRLSTLGASAVVKLGEQAMKATASLNTEKNGSADVGTFPLEDDPQLLALQDSEFLRLKTVEDAMPNIAHLPDALMQASEIELALGMESSKFAKQFKKIDTDVSLPMEILGANLLRSGRMSKRLSSDLNAILSPFTMELKMVDNSRAALMDRSSALEKLHSAKSKSDLAAAHLMRESSLLQALNKTVELAKLEMEARRTDEIVTTCDKEVEEVGQVLLNEVSRLGVNRRAEWTQSLKATVSQLKICCGERAKVWESAKQAMEANSDFNAGNK